MRFEADPKFQDTGALAVKCAAESVGCVAVCEVPVMGSGTFEEETLAQGMDG